MNHPLQYAPYHQLLVGRIAEQDTLIDWLRKAGPVVASVVGPGGVGKTHLAHVVARQLATELNADLTVLRLENQTPESWPGYLAMRLGVPLVGNELDEVPPELAERRLVLLVDNCGTGQILEMLDTSSGQQAEASPVTMLSPRELDVLELTARGYRGSEIAERLFISPNTVKRHMANIRSKLGVKSQAAAIATIQEMSGFEIRR